MYSDFFFQLLSEEKKNSCLKDVLEVKLVAD